ncbi:MAG: SIMPL domain-containing protein [Chitinophagales bacterium]
MKNILCLFIIISLAKTTFSQVVSKDCCQEKPYIEVTGSAEMEIVPDEIFITVMLTERYDGKTKMTIDKMENDMFSALKELGIDSKDVSLSDAESNFYYRKLKDDDALLSRNYDIKVKDAAMVIKVNDAMGKIDAQDVFVSKVSHSKIEEFRMETKVNATKAAKEKAGKMLTAIGQSVGAPIMLQEINSDYYPVQQRFSQLSNANYLFDGGSEDFQSQIAYQKIKIRYEVFGKFEIK